MHFLLPNGTRSRVAACLLLVTQGAAAQVLINEVNVSNITGLADGFGRREDWLELYNPTASPINLGGWFLTDKTSDSTKWAIPPGVTIAAGGHLVFICSGRNVYDGTRWHTNFGLSQMDEERVSLNRPDTTNSDNYKMLRPAQRNHSHARITSGNLLWGKSSIPTPGAANSNTFLRYAEKPLLSLQAGYYPGAISVAMSTIEPGATIRYTLNGTIPTAASTAYTVPLTISANTVVRAATFTTDPLVARSFLETNTYFIRPSHTVRTVSVAGMTSFLQTGTTPAGDQQVSVEYFDESGVFQWELEGEIRRHGNDSWAFAQRGFRLHTRDQYGTADEVHYPLFPWMTDRQKFGVLIMKPAGSDNYPAHSNLGAAHLRDGWIQTASQRGQLDLDERTYAHQITYLNGQYWGMYEMRERIDKDYTKKYYDQDEYTIDMLKYWGGLVIEHGTNAGWNALFNFVNTNSLTVQANYDYVLTQIDKENFIDNFILNTFMVNSDWLNWNTMWWRGNAAPGVKWRYALWDLDNVADLGQNYTGWSGGTGPAVNTVCNLQNMFQSSGASNGHAIIYNKLLQNPDFFWSYVNRYADLLNTALHCDTLNALLDQFEAEMLPEMPAHFTRWGGNMATWQQHIQDIRNFNCTRWNLVMAQIVDCFDSVYPISGPYQITVQIVGNGDVQVNTITIPAGPWSGNWFGGADMDFVALPDSNWAFSHWEIANNFVGQDLLDPITWLQLLQSDTITAYFTELDILPVELVTFTGTGRATDVLLEWTTASELNSSHFEVERRTAHGAWEKIGTVQAAGSSVQPIDYALIDPDPAIGINYYRLHQVDLDGSAEYSQVVAVEFKRPMTDVLDIWPNPVRDAALFHNTGDVDRTFAVVAPDGRVVRRFFLQAGERRWVPLEDLAAAIYLLRSEDPAMRMNERLIVIR